MILVFFGFIFNQSVNGLLILIPRNVKVTCLTHGDRVGGRGGEGGERSGGRWSKTPLRGEGKVRTFQIPELADGSL